MSVNEAPTYEYIEQMISESAKQVYESVQKQTEANERIIAELLMAYQELTTVTAVIIDKLWGSEIDESSDFAEKLEKERRRTIEWIRNVAAMETDKQDVADTVGKLFAAEPSNPDG